MRIVPLLLNRVLAVAVGAEDSAFSDFCSEDARRPAKPINDKPTDIALFLTRFLVVVLQDSGITDTTLLAAFLSQVPHRLNTRLTPSFASLLI